MGLPSKKQLNKHRRGARKALDTLDALNEEQKTTSSDEPNPSDKKAKKAKESTPSEKKKSVKSTAKKEKPKKQKKDDESGKPTDEIDVSQQETEIPVEADKPMEKEKPEETEKISLDLPETNNKESQAVMKTKPSGKETKSDVEKTDNVEAAQSVEEEDTLKDRFLSFRISNEDYGIEIKYVTEIIVMQKITEVPNTESFIRGVINLRGKVIPVMDIRERFHLELREYDERTCIVVVDVSDTAVGLIVDTVNEVVDIPGNKIDPPPATYSGIESSYISGMGKVGKKVKILLDVESILKLS